MDMLLESPIYAFGFYAAFNALIMLVLGMLVTRARVYRQLVLAATGMILLRAPPIRELRDAQTFDA